MRIQMKYITIFFMAFFLLLGVTGCKKTVEPSTAAPYDPYEATDEQTVVIQSIDLDAGTMSFVDIDDGKQYDLLYNNGVDVRNKYDEIMSGKLLKPGEIVDIVYNTINNKLLEISLNSDAWEVREISGFEFDKANRQAVILNQTYRYTDDLVICSHDKLIGVDEVCREDQVTARGYGGKLCSITVDLGHGYVKLENYDTYIGGMIEIGYDVIVPVTEDMLLTVREGTYRLKITKGEHSGYKNVVVVRDEECTINLIELQIGPDPVGSLFFDVTPADAKVMIDGETIDTAQTVELTYGKHRIRVSAEGYETKEGYITVNEAYRIITIELSGGEGDTGSSTNSTDNSSDTSTQDGTTEAGATESQKTGNTVTIEKPVGAYCYVDGEYKGTVPCTFDKVPGSHVVTLAMSGALVKSYTIQCLDNGKDDSYSFDSLQSLDSLLFDELD